MKFHATIRKIVPLITGLAFVMLLGTPVMAQVQVKRLGNEPTTYAPAKKVTADWAKLKDIAKFQAGCKAIIYTCSCKKGGSMPHYAWQNEYTFTWHLDFAGACNSWTNIDNALHSASKEYCETAWTEIEGTKKGFNSCSVVERLCQKDNFCPLPK